MAIDYATRYESQINEMFSRKAFTDSAVNDNYDFEGAKTVKVYNIPTVEMGNYETSGFNRYGNPEELTASVCEMTLKNDRSFTFTIDKRNNSDTQGALDAGAALARQIEHVIVPEIDKHRLKVMSEEAGVRVIKNGHMPLDLIMEVSNNMTDENCPTDGRIAFITSKFHRELKQDLMFTTASEIVHELLVTGQVGVVDGIKVIAIPSSYMPENVECIVVHPDTITAAQKLNEYKIHDNPPGINGWLVEGRICYDAFVLAGKEMGIGVVETM
ncbi:MAG: N4-gp56 family major capsid protein [Defluviitaleaceae bacterium]|nr:N4-gp56 family major capsid protein [Defluviitaleaceae bacterium]